MTRAGVIAKPAVTLAIALAGAMAAWAIAFPAPFLTGPAVFVAAAALLGIPVGFPRRVMDAALLLLGIGIGSGVTPDVIDQARRWPASFLGLLACVAVIMWVARGVLERRYGHDRRTAVLASAPGHLSFVLALSSELKADIPVVSLIQSIRIMALTLIVPVAATLIGGAAEVTGAPAEMMPLDHVAIALVLSLLLGLLFIRLRVPAALLIAGMSISTAGHLTGITGGGLPVWLALPPFLVMGAMIGARFSGITVASLRRSLSAGVAVMLIASVLALGFALVIAHVFDMPTAQVLIAFMPGGLEAMIAIAVLLDADPAFVAAHHIIRLFFLSALVPLMLRSGGVVRP